MIIQSIIIIYFIHLVIFIRLMDQVFNHDMLVNSLMLFACFVILNSNRLIFFYLI